MAMAMLFVGGTAPAQAQPIEQLGLLAAKTKLGKEANKDPETTPNSVPPSPKKPLASSRKTRKIDPFKQEQGKELLRATSQVGLGLLLIGSAYYLLGGKEPLNFSMLISPLVGGMLVKPISTIGNKLCMLFTPALAKPSLRKAINFKHQYAKRKASFTKSMQLFLESSIHGYLYHIEYFDYVVKHYERAIEEVLQFPPRPKQIEPDIACITEAVKSYPAAVRLAVGDFVVNAIADSKVKQLEKKATPLMFVGPPGTGKSRLAKQLGELLGLPVQVFDLSRYKNVNGSSFWSEDAERGILVDVLLKEQASEENFSNKILVLDEVDKVLARDEHGGFIHQAGAEISAFLHTLLEAQETATKLRRYNNATYDISHLKIILIGNHTFTEVLGKDNALALESRVTLVRFDEGFQETQKLSIARDYLATYCPKQGIDHNQVDQSVIESIVKADTRAGYKGVRVMLNVIDQYLRTLEKGALIGQVAGTPPVKFDVEKAYSNLATQGA